MRHHAARRMARCSSRLDCWSKTHDELQDTNDSLRPSSLHWRQRLRASAGSRQWPRPRSDGRRAPRRRDRSGGQFTRADGGDGRHRSLPLRRGAGGQRRADIPPPELQRAATVCQRGERRVGERRRRPDALAQCRCHRDGYRNVSQRRRCRRPCGKPRRHRGGGQSRRRHCCAARRASDHARRRGPRDSTGPRREPAQWRGQGESILPARLQPGSRNRLLDDGRGCPRQYADGCARARLFGRQLSHPRARQRRAVQERTVLRRRGRFLSGGCREHQLRESARAPHRPRQCGK